MKRLFNIEKFTRINKRSILQSVRLGLCLVSVLSISPGFAEEAYKLSGIMAGDKPTAIINDQIVAVGDWLGNVRVTRIGEDHVICQGQQGAFELKLNVSASPVIKTEKSGAVKPAVDLGAKTKTSTVAEASQGSAEIPGKARRYMEQSVEYLKEADQLLKAPLISERIYTKAADLCDLADRQAQQVFRFETGNTVRLGVKNHIDKVRQVKATILKQKADLATHYRALIAEHQIKTGMTLRDVTLSWGPPLMQNRDGQHEKWVYQDHNGSQKELIFQDGVLIGY